MEAANATGERWYPGETISVSIGQGQVSVTPASLAVMIATVANGGTRVTPHVIKAVDEGSGWKAVPPPAVADQVAFKPATLAALHDGLWMVVNAQRHRRPRPDRGPRRRRQDRHGAGDLESRAAARARHADATCATTAGSCSSRRGTTRRSPA